MWRPQSSLQMVRSSLQLRCSELPAQKPISLKFNIQPQLQESSQAKLDECRDNASRNQWD